MNLVLDSAPIVTVAMAGTDRRFPVRRVFGVGRNYASHAREMGGNPDREPPLFFTKWAETVVQTPTIPYPTETRQYQYEAELVIAIGRSGRAIAVADAKAYIFGYAAGLDMTRRDLQNEAKAQGRPWDASKNVEAGSPLGLIHRVDEVGHIERGAIELRLNGQVRQSGDVSEMMWSGADILAHLSKFYTLHPGDLVFTGTPQGVGSVGPGDRIEVRIDQLSPLVVEIASA